MVEHELRREAGLVAIQLRQRFIQPVMAGFALDGRQRQAVDEHQQVRAEQVAISIPADVLVHHMEVVVGDRARVEEAHAARLTLGILHLDVRAVHHLLPEYLVGREQFVDDPLAQFNQGRINPTGRRGQPRVQGQQPGPEHILKHRGEVAVLHLHRMAGQMGVAQLEQRHDGRRFDASLFW